MTIPGGWDVVRGAIRRSVGSSAYDAWFASVEGGFEGSTLVIRCPDAFSRDRIRARYAQAIRESLDPSIPIDFRVDPALVAPRVEPGGRDAAPRPPRVVETARPSRGLAPFERLVVGPGNALALEAARSVARGQPGHCSPLFIAARSGNGKTELCRAIRDSLGEGVVYRSSEEFTSEVTGAMRTGEMARIRHRYRRSCNVLILEDVQFLAGKRATQVELFHTLEHLLARERTVVLSGDRSPWEIKDLDAPLASRMASGFVACIAPPGLEARLDTLRAKAAGGGVRVPEACLQMLAQRPVDNVRDLLAGLNQVVARATLLGRPIDAQLVGEALAAVDVPGTPRSIGEIQALVAHVYGMTPAELCSRSRRRAIVRPRQFAMYLCRRFTDASLKDIGRAFDRDHTSVMYAVDAVERRVRERAQVRYELEALVGRISSPTPGRSGYGSSRGTRPT